jgi:transcriptional regulator with XRE-family HTH domain
MAASGAPREWLMVLGARVRDARLRQRLSQEQVAELAGVSRPYLSAVERGERNFGVVNLIRIAQALRLDAAELVQGVGGR